MSTAPTDVDRCYRHPDRQSYILCQRCGRTICPECQTPAAVGFQCPECVREGRTNLPDRRPNPARTVRRIATGDAPVITYSLIGVTTLVWVAQLVTQGLLGNLLAYFPVLTVVDPWRMITSIFAHSESSPLHLLFNMFSLWIFGRILEPMIGRGRFLALYLISGFGGSVAVLLLNPGGGVIGASGAVFGLMAAVLAIQRGLGGNGTQVLVLIALNLSIGFFVPGVSWQAHVGGVVAGLAVGFVLARTRGIRQRGMHVLLLAAVAGALVLVTILGVIIRL